jgi:hypothetical protein
MMLRSVILFVHVAGMLLLFIGIGIEWLTTAASRLALGRLYGIAFATILLSGIYLAARAHAWDSMWLRGSMGAMLLMGLLGGPLRSRVRASLTVRTALGLAAVYLMIAKIG